MKNRLADRKFWISMALGGLGGLIIGVMGIEIPFYGWLLIWLLVFAGLFTFNFIKLMMPVRLMSKGHYDRALKMMASQLEQENLHPRLRMGALYNLAVCASRKGDLDQSDRWLDLILTDYGQLMASNLQTGQDRHLQGVIHMLRANNLFMRSLQHHPPVILGATPPAFAALSADKSEKLRVHRLDEATWSALQEIFSSNEEVGHWMEFLPMVTAIEARRGESAPEDIHALLATYIHGVQPRKWVKTPGQMPLMFDEMTYTVINPFFMAIAFAMVEMDEEARNWMLQAASCPYANLYTTEAKKWLE